ncbi:MAG: alkaline phosphatase family protein [Kofleriaceae bacterium]
MTMKRRDALKTLGGLAGAVGIAKFLPGCGDGGPDGPVGITTYVYLMMENRSFDHALGGRALEGLGGDGITAALANPKLDGTLVPSFPAPDDRGAAAATVCDPDPPHGWDAAHNSFNNGANDGFVVEHEKDHGNSNALVEPMKYLTRANVPITWALADEYTICDRWFCSVMGPTLPNRAYWHTGTSFGIDNNNEVLEKFSAVPVPTIYNRLDEAGVDWCYYYGSIAVVSLLANPGPFQLDLGPNDGTGRIRRFGDSKLGVGQFFEDCAAGTLPPVVYIDPAFGTNDDHPPVHPILGQELIGSIYTALAKSPQWKNILFIVTYDENGGYFDHVPPPTTTDDTLAQFGVPGFEQMGFRVPTMVIGPYVKQGNVSSVVYDHTSALKHLQNTFGLGSLNARVDAATDLTDCLDLDRLERGDPADPITLPIIDSDEWPHGDAACMSAGGFKPSLDPISQWADANPGRFAREYDLRGGEQEYLMSIRNYLRKHQGTF